VQANGTLMWGNGDGTFYGSFKPNTQIDGRVLYEFNGAKTGAVGIVLTGKEHDAMSLTAEGGCLVIRDETKGRDHIVARICDP
jgi:hypothetical protein